MRCLRRKLRVCGEWWCGVAWKWLALRGQGSGRDVMIRGVLARWLAELAI